MAVRVLGSRGCLSRWLLAPLCLLWVPASHAAIFRLYPAGMAPVAQAAWPAPCLTGMETHCGSSRQPCASSDRLVVGGEQSHLGRVEAEQL